MCHTPTRITVRLLSIVFCLVCLVSESAGALQLSSSVTIDYQQQRITAVSKNTGQNTIRDLCVQLVRINDGPLIKPPVFLPGVAYFDSRVKSLIRPSLAVGETNRVNIAFDRLEGVTASILSRFHDASGRPFSSMSGCILTRNSDRVSLDTRLRVSTSPVDLNVSGNMKIQLINTGPPLIVKAGIYLPLEFTPSTATRVTSLAANEETILKFHITNNYALDGGSYPVHCILNDPEGAYSPAIIRTHIRVVPARTPVERYMGGIIITIGLLGGFLFYDIIFRKRLD